MYFLPVEGQEEIYNVAIFDFVAELCVKHDRLLLISTLLINTMPPDYWGKKLIYLDGGIPCFLSSVCLWDRDTL